jgi:molybdate transport system ATP-binding protein
MLEFDLSKSYGAFRLSLAARIGAEWLVLLSPSGGGKSLTLNLLAGIVRPEAGHARLHGRTIVDLAAGIDVPMRQRRIGYVFQDYALFPHMSVAENIAYGLPRRADREAVIARWLRFFHLDGKGRAYPRELSGGQRQRVALARALANQPQLLLLDEPLSALDRRIREQLQRDLAALKQELSIPVILVTHDFTEAQVLGDRVAVLDRGRMLEMDEKARLFAQPRRHETAAFLGVENVLPARVEARGAGGELTVALGAWRATVPAQARFAPGDAAYFCIRAGDVRLKVDERERPNPFSARVAAVIPEGGTNRVELNHAAGDGPVLTLLMDDYVLGRYGLRAGAPITVWLPSEKIFLCE